MATVSVDGAGVPDLDPSKGHAVEVQRLPAPGHSEGICRLQAVCTCGWRSADHLVNLDAPSDWSELYASHQCERAGAAHLCSLAQPGAR